MSNDDPPIDDEPLYPVSGAFTDLARATKEPPEWVIENLLPVGLTVVAGAPKSNKSTVTMAMACLAAGYQTDILPSDVSKVKRTGPVMIFSAEASAGELRSMVEDGLGIQIQADESILVCDDPWSFMLDDPSGHHKLMDWLEKRDPLVAIMDPFADFHTLEEKDAGEMIRLLRPVRQWAAEHKRAFILVHHARKPGNTEDARNMTPDDMRGSSAIFGKADGVIIITHRQRDRIHHFHTVLKRGGTWERDLMLPIYDRVGQQPTEALTTADKMVLDGIRSLTGCTARQISEQIHVKGDQFNNALQKLARNGLIVKGPSGNWVPKK